jgi:hypothetical protein
VSDLRVPLEPLLSAFGVPATVTRPVPDDAPITTTGIWLQPLEETRPVGADFQRRDPRKVLALPRSAVPTLPRATLIDAPEELGGAVKTWRVDGFERATESDLWRATVVMAS